MRPYILFYFHGVTILYCLNINKICIFLFTGPDGYLINAAPPTYLPQTKDKKTHAQNITTKWVVTYLQFYYSSYRYLFPLWSYIWSYTCSCFFPSINVFDAHTTCSMWSMHYIFFLTVCRDKFVLLVCYSFWNENVIANCTFSIISVSYYLLWNEISAWEVITNPLNNN